MSNQDKNESSRGNITSNIDNTEDNESSVYNINEIIEIDSHSKLSLAQEEEKKTEDKEKEKEEKSEIITQTEQKNSQETLTDEQIAKENGAKENYNSIPNEINQNVINSEYYDEFNRPRYEDIINYENNLREEMEKNSPLISDKLTIDILVAEYADSIYKNSTIEFSKKIKEWRTVRRDGNCFYRSFLFRLFEEFIIERNEKLHSKILKIIEESKKLCEENGVTWMVLEDFYNVNIKNNVFILFFTY